MDDADSSLAPSDAVSSSNTKVRSAHTTWAHAREARGQEPVFQAGRRLLYCIHCDTYSSSVTTNFRSHLRSKHGIHITEVRPAEVAVAEKLQALYRSAKSEGTAKSLQQEVLEDELDRDVILEALTALIISESLPFRLVESPEFQVFCQTLNRQSKQHIITAHSSIPGLIDKSWLEKKDIIRRKVQSASSSIHLSLDIWTSPNSHLILGVCAHFVDKEDKLCKALLGLPIVGDHSGEEQFAILLPLLHDYGILKKLGAIIGDNASTNDVLCRLIDEHFREQGEVWNASLRRIRCLGHIINLAVNAFLFTNVELVEDSEEKEKEISPALGPLEKLHNIVVHIRGSAGRMRKFKDLAGRLISLPNRTRWNSWYTMLQVTNAHASAVDSYTKDHYDVLKKDFLSPADWEYLRTVEKFLRPFYRATLAAQGDRATIDQVLFGMDALIQCLDNALVEYSAHKEFSARIKKSWEVFDKYYAKTDDSALYAAALILHPEYRIAYIRTNWKAKWQKPTLKKVKELWVSYKESFPVSSTTPTPAPKPASNLDDYDRAIRNLKKYRPASQDEYEHYSNGEPCDIGTLSAIQWWCQDAQRKKWPRLSCMAIDILSIPAMSAEPERVFSGARRTISWERSRLSPTTVEKVECSKHWMRSGILDAGI